MSIVSKLRDALDYDPDTGKLYAKHDWRDRPAGSEVGCVSCGGRYRSVHVKTRVVREHIAAWVLMTGALPGHEIGHINGNGCDNRWSNLRSATRQQNNTNQRLRRDNTSGFKGVSKVPRSATWKVQLNVGGKRECRSGFRSKETAAHAYDLWAVEVHGSFAKLNYSRPSQ